MTPARIATLIGIIAGIAAAVAPVVASMDWTSTAGVMAGVLAVAAAVVKFLDGQSKWEVANTPTVAIVPDVDTSSLEASDGDIGDQS